MSLKTTEYWGDSSSLWSAAHQQFVIWFWRIAVAGSALLLLFGDQSPIRLVSYLSLVLVGACCLYMLSRGRHRLASYLAVYLPFIWVTLILLYSRNLMLPATAAFPVVIIYGGWLLGGDTALSVLGGAVLAVVGVSIYLVQGGTPALPGPSPFVHAATLAFYYAIAWAVGKLSERSYAERTRQAETFAFRDQLTGLPNRNLLFDRLEQEIRESKANDHLSTLLLVNIKDFQLINNSLGHKNGDLMLKQVAERLQECASAAGTVARLGGGIFAVLIPCVGTGKIDAIMAIKEASQRIFLQFDKKFSLNGQDQHGEIAIGATVFGQDVTDSIELLREAELATRESRKQNGRLQFYNSNFQELASRRAATEEALRQAIEHDQFELHYQPQFCQNRLVGVEALIRWRHPERGLVSPAEFIPVAEDSGLVIPMGDWVVNEACRQIQAWKKHPVLSGISVAVNVSAAQIALPNFSERVLTAVFKTNISPSALKLELTESAFVEDAERVVEKMRALRGAGIRFSLDDFGTGYSSLSYLKRLPLDQLKIDQLFVRGLLSDPDDAMIARTIINLGRDFGLDVIAEGVETEAQRDFLLQNGCETFQGYFYAKPLPANELEIFAGNRV